MMRSSWPIRLQQREYPDTDRRARKTADKQHAPELHVQRSAPEMGDRAGDRGGDHLVRPGRNGDDGRNVVEDEKRRDQKAAADTEHAGQEADGRTHAQDDENVHRQFCDGQIDCHSRPRIMNCPRRAGLLTSRSNGASYGEIVARGFR